MTEHELKLMSEHLGHDLEVNMDVYRLQTSTLEKTKVARLLVAVDSGMAHKFRGHQLTEIGIEGKLSMWPEYMYSWLCGYTVLYVEPHAKEGLHALQNNIFEIYYYTFLVNI